ncbi:MAG: hypothetical protein IPP63_20640 [Chloracidobacterium sp.]|nr:hypothetical protein [Chloracidobacterium sp.]
MKVEMETRTIMGEPFSIFTTQWAMMDQWFDAPIHQKDRVLIRKSVVLIVRHAETQHYQLPAQPVALPERMIVMLIAVDRWVAIDHWQSRSMG